MIEFSLFLSVIALFYSKVYFSIFWISQCAVLFIFCFAKELGQYSFIFSLFILVSTLTSFLFNFFFISNNAYFTNKSNCSFYKNSYGLVGFTVGISSLFFYLIGAGGFIGITRSWVDIAVERTSFELLLTNLSQLLYLLSLALLLFSYDITKKTKFIFAMSLIAILFLALSRAKAYLLPFLFSLVVIFFHNNKNKPFKMFFLGILYSLLIVFFYFATTFFRWIGGSEKWSSNNFINVMQLVLDKGLERNLVDQATGIFSYYVDNQIIWGQTYLSFFNPILKLFEYNIENPIYIYHYILNGQSFGMKGSAHPTLFTDSFANFGILGVFSGVFWMSILFFLYKICSIQNRYGMIVFIVSTSYAIPLILRGSVYYGFLYLILSVLFMLFFGMLCISTKNNFKS